MSVQKNDNPKENTLSNYIGKRLRDIFVDPVARQGSMIAEGMMVKGVAGKSPEAVKKILSGRGVEAGRAAKIGHVAEAGVEAGHTLKESIHVAHGATDGGRTVSQRVLDTVADGTVMTSGKSLSPVTLVAGTTARMAGAILDSDGQRDIGQAAENFKDDTARVGVGLVDAAVEASRIVPDFLTPESLLKMRKAKDFSADAGVTTKNTRGIG